MSEQGNDKLRDALRAVCNRYSCAEILDELVAAASSVQSADRLSAPLLSHECHNHMRCEICGSLPIQSAIRRRCAVDESACLPECDGDTCAKMTNNVPDSDVTR